MTSYPLGTEHVVHDYIIAVKALETPTHDICNSTRHTKVHNIFYITTTLLYSL